MSLTIECYAITHIGNHRKNNEDNFYMGSFLTPAEQLSISQTQTPSVSKNSIANESENRVFAVSDGMGGHEYGEVASYIVVDNLNKFSSVNRMDRCTKKKDKYTFIHKFQETVSLTNKEINDFAEKRNVGANMGATFSGLIVFSNEIVPFNIGDSSTFIIEKGNMLKLTVDDNELSLMGGNENHKLEAHGKRLTKYFGLPNSFGILTATISKPIKLKKKQIFLIATDGLTDHLSQDEMYNIIESSSDIKSATEKLVKEALNKENGGRDNITVVMLKIKNKNKKRSMIK